MRVFGLFDDLPQKARTLEARIELASGEVKVSEGGTALPQVSGAPLKVGARVLTSPGGRALVRLSDGTAVFLGSGSVVELTREGVRLESGQVWVDAASREKGLVACRVNEVVVSAAGAGFELVRGDGEVTVYAARGSATVEGPAFRAEVRAGERARVRGGAAEVKPVAFWEDWTGGMASHSIAAGLSGAGTLYGVEVEGPPGIAARPLQIDAQHVRVVVRDGMAEVEVDQKFFNPGERAVEGWYWFSVPEGALVTGFALETFGSLVEGELVERGQAKEKYEASASAGFQPALLEWVDGRSYRARIYPVNAGSSRRVVLRYLQQIPMVEGRLRFVYPMQAQRTLRITDFSLNVDLGDLGTRMEISTLADARVEDGGRRVTMRRTGYRPVADFHLEAKLKQPVPPVRVSRFVEGANAADYLMLRYVPDLDWSRVAPQSADVIVVVDTSASGDVAAQRLKTDAAEAVLRSLAADDRFALVALDVKPTVLYPAEGVSKATEPAIVAALEKLAGRSPGGATDLSALFDAVLPRLHGAEQPAIVYVGDGWVTSGELSGEALSEHLGRKLGAGRARFFTVASGAGANQPLLAELARAGGGRFFALEEPSQATDRALEVAAAIKTPTLAELEVDFGAGLDDVFMSARGKVSRGEEVVMLARSHHDLPRRVTVKGRLGGKPFEKAYDVVFEEGPAKEVVPKLWAAEAIRKLLGTTEDLEQIRGNVVSLGVRYGLMTPFTSFIALDNEQAYATHGIPRRQSRLRGARLVAPPEKEAPVPVAAAAEKKAPSVREWNREPPEGKQNAPKVFSPPGRVHSTPAASPEPGGISEKRSSRKRVEVDATKPVVLGMSQELPSEAPAAAFPKQGLLQYVQSSVGPSVCSLSTSRSPCSDISRRPLSERSAIWARRLSTAESVSELLERYQAAAAACELRDWPAEARFLELLQRHLHSPEDAVAALGQIGCRGEARRYLARLLLRRAVDERMVAAVESAFFGSRVDWAKLDLELSGIADPARRMSRLRLAIAQSPEDPEGTVRLCKALLKSGNRTEALLHARRLRDQGFATPAMLREVGDLLVADGQVEEAERTYSEIVEFDGTSFASRQLLGDIYLALGWNDAAYRQYRTLTEIDPSNAVGWLRLASAAAGSGRLDEALRLERKVAEAEGTPGANDPRRWARLKSAARLAQTLKKPPAGEGDPAKIDEAMRRRLRELQLFNGPGSLVLVTWNDPSVDLALAAGESATVTADPVDASAVGLAGAFLPQGATASFHPVVKVRGGRRAGSVTFTRHDLEWDGQKVNVAVREVSIPAGETSVRL